VLTLFLGPGSPAVDAARHIQFIASWSYILFGMTIVLFGTMRAGGVVIAPIIVLAVAMYPVRLGFYAAAYPVLGPDAIWLSFPVGSAAAMLMATVAYRRPGWRQKARVVDQDECSEDTHADGECDGRMAPSL
jgi:Na+-driven multidrug efflux pump